MKTFRVIASVSLVVHAEDAQVAEKRAAGLLETLKNATNGALHDWQIEKEDTEERPT